MSKELTNEQGELVLEEWNRDSENPPSLYDLTKMVFPKLEKVDGRCKEGRMVKEFLAKHGFKARPSNEYKPKDKIELTEEHKSFCLNNGSMMSYVEIARIVFDNPELNNLSQESRAVKEYIDSLGDQIVPFEDTLPQRLNEYEPPRTFSKTLAKIKKYAPASLPEDTDKITAKGRKEIDSLSNYLATYRFVHQINTYSNEMARDLFESSFVRYTHDKGDLTQEEVDQYIVLSTEVVIASNIQRRVEHLNRLLDDSADDTEGRRISMSLVEAINTSQNEYNQSVNRQQKLLGDLKEKRSDKLKKQLNNNASILNLVEMWKSEESRHKMIGLAQLRQESMKDEIQKLGSMDEIKCRILGVDENEVV